MTSYAFHTTHANCLRIIRCLRFLSLVVTVRSSLQLNNIPCYMLLRCCRRHLCEQHLDSKLTHPLAQPLVHIVFLQDVLVQSLLLTLIAERAQRIH